jgi:outer membrane protein assembly factor BamB
MTGNVVSDFNNSSGLDNVEEFDYSSVNIKLEVSYDENTYKETATIYAQDKEGNTLWSRETGAYDAAQLESFSEIGKKDDKYYYTEGGTVVALNIETGVVLWENKDFGGYSVRYVFGENSIYLCGFFGPDFFEVSYDGATVKRIDTINDNYWYAVKIEDANEKIAVTFDSSEDGDGGTFYVDKKSYNITK